MVTWLLLLSISACSLLVDNAHALRYRCRLQQCHTGYLAPRRLFGQQKDDHDDGSRTAANKYWKWRGGGGGSALGNSDPIEWNPEYPLNEHEVWLQEQQNQNQHRSKQQSTFSFPLEKETSLIQKTQNYFVSLRQISPSLFWSTLLCMAVFGLWHAPQQFIQSPNSILYRYFVNSHENFKKTLGLSLVLSSFSHISFYHLMVNLFSFSHLGPSVRELLLAGRRFRPGWLQQQHQQRYHPWRSAMWPLLLSSSVFSNGFFLLMQQGRGRAGAASSIGLSGITMTLLAIQAMATPNRQYGIVLGVIPISLQAKHFLLLSILVSLVGTLCSSASWFQQHLGRGRGGAAAIAHGAHLGGLVYGMLYYELVILGLTPRQVLHKTLRSLR